jgi:hypothetical protein
MDTTGIASLASSTSAMRTGDAVGVSVLKKAMDIQKANAMALIQALPPVPAPNLPAHLGQNINTTA